MYLYTVAVQKRPQLLSILLITQPFLLGRPTMSGTNIGPALKKPGGVALLSNMAISNNIHGWRHPQNTSFLIPFQITGDDFNNTSVRQRHSRIYRTYCTYFHFISEMITVSDNCAEYTRLFHICYSIFTQQSLRACAYQSSPFLNYKIQLPSGTLGHPEHWQMWLLSLPLSAHTYTHMQDNWALIPLMWQQ